MHLSHNGFLNLPYRKLWKSAPSLIIILSVLICHKTRVLFPLWSTFHLEKWLWGSSLMHFFRLVTSYPFGNHARSRSNECCWGQIRANPVIQTFSLKISLEFLCDAQAPPAYCDAISSCGQGRILKASLKSLQCKSMPKMDKIVSYVAILDLGIY